METNRAERIVNITGLAQLLPGTVRSRRDFMPFGEELDTSVGARSSDNGLNYSSETDNVRQKFTGYQKDAETSLDFAEARMYENRNGRFTAVDPLLASGKSANPQTFNRYVYTMNRPLIMTDSTGLQTGGSADEVVAHISTVIDKAGRDITAYFSRMFSSASEGRSNYLLNAGTNLSELDSINYRRSKNYISMSNGDSGSYEGVNRRLIGNMGPTTDSVWQGFTDSIDTAHKINTTALTIEEILLLIPSTGGSSSVTTNRGYRFQRARLSCVPLKERLMYR